MKFGDDQGVQTIIKSVVYRYSDIDNISIRYTFSDTELIFLLRRGDKEYEYHIPSYDLISLYPIEMEGKLITIIEDKLISKKEEDMTVNLGTVDSLSTKFSDYVYKNMVNPCTMVPGQRNGKTIQTTEYINHLLSDALCKPMVKKIIKSGPCTIVIWQDNTKTIVRLREGEKDDEFAAFSAAVVKKLYGSNSAVTKIIKKKTFVQEKKESQ